MKIVGMDPSFKNWGFAIGSLDLDTLKVTVDTIKTTKTEPTKNKKIRKNSDDLERTRLLSAALKENLVDADMVFVEIPHGSQSARAMASYGICIMGLAFVEQPLIQLTESQLKKTIFNSNSATKREMIEEMAKRHPELDWPMHKGKIANTAEHMADAIAAIYAGLESDQFKDALAVLRFMKQAS